MNKELGIYAIILGLSLGGAYYASLPQDDLSEGSKKIASLDAKVIKKVTFEKERLTVTVEQKNGGHFWATYQVTPAKPKDSKTSVEETSATKTETKAKPENGPNASEDALSEKQTSDTENEEKIEAKNNASGENAFIEPLITKTEFFPVGTAWNDFLALFKPLKSLRDLGTYEKAKASDFGLDKPSVLKIYDQSDKELLSLNIGKKSFGGSNNYAQLSGTSELQLIDNELVAVMEQARSRLFEGNLWSKSLNEYKMCRINSGERKRILKNSDTENGKAALWLDENKSKENLGFSYGSWMEKLEKLRAVRYAHDDELKVLNDLPALATVTFDDGLDSIVFIKASGKELSPAISEDTYWVKSSFTSAIAMVTKARSESLIQELEQIFPKE